jgi:hypothetical protein
MGPPPAEGGRRPHKTPLRMQKLFAPNRYNTISHYKLSFWAAASAQRALAAAVRARPPAGRARPSPLRIKKALASKWYKLIEETLEVLLRYRRGAAQDVKGIAYLCRRCEELTLL